VNGQDAARAADDVAVGFRRQKKKKKKKKNIMLAFICNAAGHLSNCSACCPELPSPHV